VRNPSPVPLPKGGEDEFMKIQLRAVNESDRDDILRWRNDPMTRQMSLNTELITAQQHAEWFGKLLCDRQQKAFMAENPMGEKVGMVRFKWLYDDTYEVDVNVAPEKRGRGLGTLMIMKGCQAMVVEKNVGQFFARIKAINERSLKSFLKAGFQQVDTIDEVNVFRFKV